MSNRIAIVWDFDKTLIPGYMQEPIFQKYHVNGDDFWKEVNALPEKIKKEQHQWFLWNQWGQHQLCRKL